MLHKKICVKDPLAIFACLIFLAAPLGAQKARIEKKDGVTIIKNPKRPVEVPGGPTSLTLIEELCLGSEPSSDYMFEELRSVKVDNEGDIIVLDWSMDKILVFDDNGRFLRSFGRKGQGPEELQSPSRMYLKAGRDICIMDSGNNRMAYYSKEGECLEEIPMVKQRVFRTVPDSLGNIYGDRFAIEQKVKYELVKFDPKLNPLQVITEYERHLTPGEVSPIIERLVYTVLADDRLAWALTSEYAIHFVDPSGNPVRIIRKDTDNLRIKDEDKERLIQEMFGDDPQIAAMKMTFPKHYLPMYYFLCDDRGRTFVRTYRRNREFQVQWDIFDEEGRYILSFFLPPEDLLMDIKNDKAYAMIQADENGLPLVKRYRLDWK